MIKNIFKGFIIGIGKIVPGVSGSMLAILFGVYERALSIISNIRKIRCGDLLFLLSLVFGVFLGISIFSRGVKWLLDCFYFPTMLLFNGLIISGIADIGKELTSDTAKLKKCSKVKLMLIFVVSFIFSCWITSLGSNALSMSPNWNVSAGGILNYLLFYFLGIIEAFSSIVPGISGTAIFMSLGCYDLLLSFFENIFDVAYWRFGVFFFLGVISGIYVLAKIIVFFLEHYKVVTYMAILGFMVSAVWIMFEMTFDAVSFFEDSISLATLGVGLFNSGLWLLIGYSVGKKINGLLSND